MHSSGMKFEEGIRWLRNYALKLYLNFNCVWLRVTISWNQSFKLDSELVLWLLKAWCKKKYSYLIRYASWLMKLCKEYLSSLYILHDYFITMTSQWAWWRLRSPASGLFTQPFIQTQIKENIKAPRHWPLCGEFTGTGEFPAQRASYAEYVSIWWRHHVMWISVTWVFQISVPQSLDDSLLFAIDRGSYVWDLQGSGS